MLWHNDHITPDTSSPKSLSASDKSAWYVCLAGRHTDGRYQSQLRTSQFRRVAEMQLTIPWLILRVLRVHF